MFEPGTGKMIMHGIELTMRGGDQARQIEHLTQVVRVLWRQVENLERALSVTQGSVKIRNGDASIELKRDGSVNVRGNHISINGTGNIQIKASGPIVLKGSKIEGN
jgi:hypothetical protein